MSGSGKPKKYNRVPADKTEFETAVVTAVKQLRIAGLNHVKQRDICIECGWEYTESTINRIGFVFRNTLHLTRRCRCVYCIAEVPA